MWIFLFSQSTEQVTRAPGHSKIDQKGSLKTRGNMLHKIWSRTLSGIEKAESWILTFVVVFGVFLVVVGFAGLVLGWGDGAGSPERPGGQHGQRALGAGAQAQRDRVLGRLLPLQRDLRRHHPLPLRNQVALRAVAVLVPAVPLVALEPRHHPVVPASRALRLPRAFLRQRIQRSRQLTRGQHLHHLKHASVDSRIKSQFLRNTSCTVPPYLKKSFLFWWSESLKQFTLTDGP